jgi:hypothetical protein
MHACVCYQQQKQSGPPQISFQNPFFSTLEDYMRHFHNSMMMIQGTQSCLRPILECDPRLQILASSNLVQEKQEIPPNSTPCIKLVLPQGPTTTRQVLVRGWLVPIASGAYYIPGKYWHEAGTYCLYCLRSYQSGHTLKLLEFGRDERRGSCAAGK